MIKRVTAFAPASVSNLGCGFDVFGFAMQQPGDRITVERSAGSAGIRIRAIYGDDGRLPLAPEKNTAAIAAHQVCLISGRPSVSLELEIFKEMPFASGIGSSAASAAAAARAVNALLGEPLDEKTLLRCVIAAEAFISGTAHADNAAPALWGGLILSRCAASHPPDVQALPVPRGLFYVVLHTDIDVNTRQARAALPESIPLKTAVRQWANTAAVVQAIYQEDWALLARAMTDWVAEPVRARYIPHYEACRQAALDNGALTFNISGSGPSVFAFCEQRAIADKVARAWEQICRERGLGFHIWSDVIRNTGAEILEIDD